MLKKLQRLFYLGGLLFALAARTHGAAFDLENATIAKINAAFDSGSLTSWFAELGPDAPYHSIEEFLEKGTYNKEIVPRILEQKKFSGAEHRAEYERRLLKMHEFRALLVDLMDRYALDGLVYPIQMKLVAQHADRNTDRNGFLASIAMLPAINVPADYSAPTKDAPNGVPIGMDILGRPFD